MKIKMNGWRTITLVVVLVAFITVIYLMKVSYNSDSGDNSSNSDDSVGRNYCNERAEVCTEIYSPVCGWFIEDIKCIKYPCAETYSNGCFACADSKVAYWTEGECPSG